MSEQAFKILCLILVALGLGLYIAAAVIFLTGGSKITGILFLAWGSGSISIVMRALWRRHHPW